MTGSILPPGPLAYEGQTSVPYINKPFAPPTNGPKFPVPTIWTDTVGEDTYINVTPNEWIPIGSDNSLFPVTPYVVGPAGQAGYQTIQSAINAANTAGGGIVVVQPGTYTENLTLYSNVHVMGMDFADAGGGVTIIGLHTPPTAGGFCFNNVALQSSTHIFSSTAAGSTHLILANAAVTVTNGYTFNLSNWTGKLESFDVNAAIGTNDGYVNNTGGSEVDIFECSVGSGTSNPMIVSGFVLGAGANIYCPVQFQTGSTAEFDYSFFGKSLTFSNNSTGTITTSHFSSGANAAITMSSSAAWNIYTSVIDSSNNPAIAGTGAGTLKLTDVTFVNNASLAGTLTVSRTSTTDLGSIRSNFTNHGVVLGQGTGATLTATAAGTTGQVLTGVTGADPTFQTTPTNACSFRAVKSASTTNATGDSTVVTLLCNTSVFDSGSNYNTGTGQFTAPTTGKYLIGFNIELGNLSAGHTKAVYSINNTGSGAGSAILNINPFNNASSDGLYTFSWSGYINLTAADVITITVAVYNSTKTVSIDGNGTGITEFWGVRLT